MTVKARLTALLALLFITPLAQAQAGPVAGTAAPPAVSAHPTVTYAPGPQGTLVLPPPPPLMTVPAPVSPLPVSPVVTYRPLVPVVPLPAQYYLGQGLLGQPKLYVPNQPVRNFLRYLSP